MKPILEMRGIRKTFPGVVALNRVDLSVNAGEIHAIVGENGAGKSTLMKILSGVYPAGSYEGEIIYEDQPRRFKDIRDSEKLGIIIIHQELALVPMLSIAENIFLGNEQSRHAMIDWGLTYHKTLELLKKVGLNESPSTLITHLGVGKQQMIEIAKALSKQVKLLILDEPTASLNQNDSDALLALLLEFKAQGISCVLITHKLNEVAKVADRITVLRDGSSVDLIDCQTEPVNEDRIIKSMVGREMADRYPRRTPMIGEVVLEIKNWQVYHPEHSDRTVIKKLNLSLRKGEIVGIAGLMGAGRTEFAMSLFGRSYGKKISGEAFMKGQKIDLSTIQKAIAHGIAYVTEDRKSFGLILNEDLQINTSLAHLKGVSEYGVLDASREYKTADNFRKQLNIRTPSVLQKAINLSGGNQQKVVLSKWLFTAPEILILDEPTRGIDVGAKYEIYTIIHQLAIAGKTILLISSEMPELLGMCDRICVMDEGQWVGEFSAHEASQEKIMRAIMQSHQTPPSTATY